LVARKSLVECSFLIPTRRDKNLADGQPHTTDAWGWLEQALAQFGGGAQAMALYRGWYLDQDTKEPVRDLSRKYVVAVRRKNLPQLRAVLREACGVFKQKCIYLSVAGQVEFIEGPADEPP
jgi:hypothetical protein